MNLEEREREQVVDQEEYGEVMIGCSKPGGRQGRNGRRRGTTGC